MRDRAWRRYTEDRIVLRRLNRLRQRRWCWGTFSDVNGTIVTDPIISDYIGNNYNFMYKNYTTVWSDTRYNIKYSPNRGGDRYYRPNSNTRESCKLEFLRILREHGIK